MNIREVIEDLQKLDPELQVYFYDSERSRYGRVEETWRTTREVKYSTPEPIAVLGRLNEARRANANYDEFPVHVASEE